MPWAIRTFEFQSTLPARGSDALRGTVRLADHSFNPRSPRGGATLESVTDDEFHAVSIHAPREGERHVGLAHPLPVNAFQSTLPARGSDDVQPARAACTDNVSIHAPREGERRHSKARPPRLPRFQSTLPARGSDKRGMKDGRNYRPFQSTLPARGSDLADLYSVFPARTVSIHAPREGERPEKVDSR